MRIRNAALQATLALVVLLGLPLQVLASPITIQNAGFEAPVTATTAFPPVGWTVTPGFPNQGGVWNIVDWEPIPGGYWGLTTPTANTPPEGKQIGYLSLGPEPGVPSGLRQTLATNLTANTTYQLSGYVGHPLGFATGTIYTVSLYAGGTQIGTISSTGPEANFAQFNLFANSSLFPSAVGQALEIRLESNKAQTGFDAIALATVPDGGLTVTLLGIAFMGVEGLRRKLKK